MVLCAKTGTLPWEPNWWEGKAPLVWSPLQKFSPLLPHCQAKSGSVILQRMQSFPSWPLAFSVYLGLLFVLRPFLWLNELFVPEPVSDISQGLTGG